MDSQQWEVREVPRPRYSYHREAPPPALELYHCGDLAARFDTRAQVDRSIQRYEARGNVRVQVKLTVEPPDPAHRYNWRSVEGGGWARGPWTLTPGSVSDLDLKEARELSRKRRTRVHCARTARLFYRGALAGVYLTPSHAMAGAERLEDRGYVVTWITRPLGGAS